MSKRFVHLAAALAVLAFSASAQAGSLGLVSGHPDITSINVPIEYTYSSGTGSFVVNYGTTSALNGITLTGAGQLNLTANFNVIGSGATAILTPTSGSSLSVTGNTGSGLQTFFASSSLLAVSFTTDTGTGNPNNFETFEFLFGPGTPGTSLYGSQNIGIILSSNLPASYASNFMNGSFTTKTGEQHLYQSGNADTFAVPLPPAAFMGLSALVCVPLLRLRRRRA